MASQLLLLVTVFSIMVVSSAAMYSNKVVLDGGKYNASWYYDKEMDTLNFTVVAEATGWVGFGVSKNKPPPSMDGYDVAVAGVQAGNGYITDYLTTDTVRPTADSQQDFNLTYSEEADGKTTVMFSRKRDTGDAVGDLVIEVDTPMYLVWAYHSTSDSDSMASLTQHSEEGVVEVTFIQSPPVPPPPMMNYTGSVSLNNGQYNASWLYKDGMDYVYFRVDVNATGWVGFGLANYAPTRMMNYDVAVGGVMNGTGYLKDYFTNGTENEPPEDMQQDWNLTYSREMDGVITLLFHRKINTNDEMDVVIEQKEMFLIWAYHSTYEVAPSFMQHSKSGFHKVQIIPDKHVTFKNGAFNAYWSYDGVMDALKFKVVVNATGWVAFGFAKQAPTNMMNYDVAVGGVYNGTGYLKDYLTRAREQVPADAQQDFKLTNATEEGGVTTLMFYRKRNTWDSEDLVVMGRQKLFLVWAYTQYMDLQAGSPPPKHLSTDRGFTAEPVQIIGHQETVMQFDKHMSFNNGAFKAYWSYDSETDTLRFKLVVKATGWISFGFAKARGAMIDYDVAVGGVLNNGDGYLQDYFTRAVRQVPADTQQDFKLTYAREEGGVTTLMFYRKRDTCEYKEDVNIQGRQKLFLVWAYHTSSDKNVGDFQQHDNAGGTDQAVEIIAQDTAPVIEYDKYASFDSGAFKVYWMYDSAMDMLRFKLVVKATGWISFGFAEKAPSGMTNYDVAVGGVWNGNGYIKDYLTRAFGKVPADSQQDITLVYSSEKDGVTTLMYNRKRDTGDYKEDLNIEGQQKLFLVWAYTTDNKDITPSGFPEHDNRGSSKEAVEIISQATPPVIKYDKHMSFDGGAFKAYWMYDNDMDMLKFKLVVKATGWISFGFAEKAPSGMKNYDVAVGGVSTGNGYIQDYLTRALSNVTADNQQDFTLVSSSEEGGYTTLMFNRKRDTGDDEDLVIEGGQKYFVVWAYDTSEDKTSSKFSKHDKKGSSAEAVEIISQATPTTASPTTANDAGGLSQQELEEARKEREMLKILVAVSLGIVALTFIVVVIGFAYLSRKVRVGPMLDSKLK